MDKTASKTELKSGQLIETKKNNRSYTPQSAVKVTNLKQAKRLLSKLIFDLQTGTIKNQDAKDLTYLLVSYVNVFKQYEIEQRLDAIEKKIDLREY